MTAAHSATAKRYIGIMSGTSLDAVDVVSLLIDEVTVTIEQVLSYPIPNEIRESILQRLTVSHDELNLTAQLDRQLGELFADAVLSFLDKYQLSASDVVAIGSHGQTIRHFPDLPNGFSLQIGDANAIAVKTGIDVVADFRKKDIALGGQGAPLVPAFHQQVFTNSQTSSIILNIGGIANLTFLPKTGPVFGFDTGPGNTLIDQWFQQHHNSVSQSECQWDENGNWAKSGKINEALLQCMLADEYFARTGPKSTGREYFHLAWLHDKLAQANAINTSPKDIQSTLCALTAQTITDAIKQAQQSQQYDRLILCGGGAYNLHLRALLAKALPDIEVADSKAFGIDVDWVEAAAFAWFAHCFIQRIPSNVPEVTGASRLAVLGSLFPAC